MTTYNYSRRTWLEACITWAEKNRPRAVEALKAQLAEEIRRMAAPA